MNDSVFVDTNVLVYLFDADSPEKQERARAILEIEGPSGRLVLSTQVLQEFFVSVTRKLKPPVPPSEAEAAARDLAALDVVEIEAPMVFRAISRSRRHTLSLWDALIVEAALARGCTRLLSEDLQDGRRFGGLVVENPFARS
jgi:predicted nucleic acid-binding protein